MKRKYGRRQRWSKVERDDGGDVLEHTRGGADVMVVAEWRGMNGELTNRYGFFRNTSKYGWDERIRKCRVGLLG